MIYREGDVNLGQAGSRGILWLVASRGRLLISAAESPVERSGQSTFTSFDHWRFDVVLSALVCKIYEPENMKLLGVKLHL